ncbi:hypothetical protein DR999_PMT23908 [Platysternon megacephalum]|uniref:Uncharacterized protein n=1 Tax=Platysternon megacephalum TaxID=55544 RepID=A0A4D9DF64_9SAUR|nr:hypothetical protein DR999_PMT23908 [Platysternon megacephalum]
MKCPLCCCMSETINKVLYPKGRLDSNGTTSRMGTRNRFCETDGLEALKVGPLVCHSLLRERGSALIPFTLLKNRTNNPSPPPPYCGRTCWVPEVLGAVQTQAPPC